MAGAGNDVRVFLLAAAVVAFFIAFRMVKHHGFWMLTWRWLSGHTLDGQYRTDATWFRPSSVALHPLGRADSTRVHSWHHRPRIQRAGIRTGATVGTLLLAWCLAFYRTVTLLVLGVVAVLAVLALGWWLYHQSRRVRHHLTWHRPVHRALSKELTAPPTRLEIEPDRSKVTIGLPEAFTGSDREREAIKRVVTVKLALESPDPDWSGLTGRKPQVVFTRSEPPPPKVTLRAVRSAIEAAAAHELVMGKGKKDALVKASLDEDSPHIGLSMGSGDGKSTVARSIAAQVLYHGGLLLVIDYKLISHQWARGLPNVAYAGTVEEIHAALCWLGWDERDDEGNVTRESELTRRKNVMAAGADIEGVIHADVGPRLLVVAEELNATQGRLKAYWRRIGGKGPSPASEALDEGLFIGRGVGVNVLQIGQRLSAKATSGSGSADSRENLGLFLFHDPAPATWKMLIGDRHALPPASGHTGRLQVVTAREVRETQGTWMTGKEARQLALSGTIALPRPDMPFVAPVTGATPRALPGGDQRFVTVDGPTVTALPPGSVSLADAVEAGLFPSLGAARRASHRDGFPGPVGRRGTARMYDVADLHLHLLRKERV